MPIDPPLIMLIAIVALLVASMVAQRAGAHADSVAGRRPVKGADRRGSLGAVVDMLDRSVAAYTIRKRLGRSTLTRAERRAADQRAAAVAQAEEIRRLRSGPPSAVAPKRIVVAGTGTGAAVGTARIPGAPRAARSTVSVELLAAGLGLAVVVAIVVGIWPRERGGVAGATGVPAVSTAPSPVPTGSESASPEAIGS
jgi:hypothetical protein